MSQDIKPVPVNGREFTPMEMTICIVEVGISALVAIAENIRVWEAFRPSGVLNLSIPSAFGIGIGAYYKQTKIKGRNKNEYQRDF